MFTLEEPAPNFPRSLKRLHEDDQADIANGTVGFTEHRNKRIHSLPLRSSPTAKRWSPPTSFFQAASEGINNTITPSDSDSEDATFLRAQQQQQEQPSQFAQQWEAGHAQQQLAVPSVTETTDMDMDMAMDVAEPSPQHPQSTSPNHLEPGPFQPDPIATSITGRMPTPIQPSFAAQVRGNHWGGAAGNVMQTGGSPIPHDRPHLSPFGIDGPVDTRLQLSQACPDRSVPRVYASLNDISVVQNRSLPSPISESGGEEMGSPDMVLDGAQFRCNSAGPSHHTPFRSHSTMSLPYSLPDANSQGGGSSEKTNAWSPTDENTSPSGLVNAHSMDTDPPATPSPKKGHTRSRHTLNSWTLQPGMKKSFSIGYRADCEKCRNKVPGHFNHIIVS